MSLNPTDLSVIWIVSAAAFGASILKLYSGFGLGTLLLPILALFYPIPVAVGLTAIVHLASNLFKLALTGRYANRSVLLWFGLPAVTAAFAGAELLRRIPPAEPLAAYTVAGHAAVVTPLKLMIAGLMIFFAAMEAVPALRTMTFRRRWLPIGGALSGFFGGLSGHQGAFRSAFLSRSDLNAQSFIGTGVVISCGVDLVRLAVYNEGLDLGLLRIHGGILLAAVTATSLGAWIGTFFIQKARMDTIRTLVAGLLLVYAALLGTGIL